MKKLNGWQRLWVFLSAIYLCAVITFAVPAFPKSVGSVPDEEVWERLTEDSLNVLSANSGMLDNKENWTREYGVLVPMKLPKSSKEDIEKLKKDYISAWHAADAAALRRERTKFLKTAAAIWFTPCIFVFMVGWGVRWVRAGFA